MADNKKELICPACHTNMTKILVEECGHHVDICTDGCGGIYFDNRELEHFDEKNESIDTILKALEGKEFKEVDKNEKRICPVCNTPMVKNHTSKKHNVEIDCCYNCGGKFLDNNELQEIRKEYDTEIERQADFMESFSANFKDVVEETKIRDKKAKEEYNTLKNVILEEFLNWKNNN